MVYARRERTHAAIAMCAGEAMSFLAEAGLHTEIWLMRDRNVLMGTPSTKSETMFIYLFFI